MSLILDKIIQMASHFTQNKIKVFIIPQMALHNLSSITSTTPTLTTFCSLLSPNPHWYLCIFKNTKYIPDLVDWHLVSPLPSRLPMMFTLISFKLISSKCPPELPFLKYYISLLSIYNFLAILLTYYVYSMCTYVLLFISYLSLSEHKLHEVRNKFSSLMCFST